MQANEIFEKLQGEFGEEIIELHQEEYYDPSIKIKPEKSLEIALYLRDEEDLKFDYMVNLSGMDFKKYLQSVWHLYSYEHKHRIVIKIDLDRDNPVTPSVERCWKTANWHEREAYDMYGIIFDGHPNLIRILTPYDWEGWPLRKDYKEPKEYHGVTLAPNKK